MTSSLCIGGGSTQAKCSLRSRCLLLLPLKASCVQHKCKISSWIIPSAPVRQGVVFIAVSVIRQTASPSVHQTTAQIQLQLHYSTVGNLYFMFFSWPKWSRLKAKKSLYFFVIFIFSKIAMFYTWSVCVSWKRIFSCFSNNDLNLRWEIMEWPVNRKTAADRHLFLTK